MFLLDIVTQSFCNLPVGIGCFIEHQHAREIGDKKMMEKIEYHLTYINFHYECGLLATGQYDKLPEVIKYL